ncbi:NADP-dependent oxidoreductase [Nesterenkonia sp. NBAIMH1]|uniref:NADP-dependent oxidoreductase n=1 Tax=Nesterenkonia sp. NBAIMH1 TaxID=2600320 RepID=UPI0011B6842C
MTYSQYGDPDTLELTEEPSPKVAPGAVLIRVERASVNPVDWKLMSGGLDGLLDVFFPVIPGWDVAGVVEEVGPDVPEFAPGDRVAAYARKDFVHGGTYAEYVSLRASDVARLPEGVEFDAAAAVPLAGLTAMRSIEALGLTDQDTLLIHAASGGVGHFAAQLAAETGATVIGTASEKNHGKLRDLGVTPVAYGEGLVDRVREAAPSGVTAVADFAGGVMEQTLELLPDARRQVSVTDFDVLEHGGRIIWVRPDAQRLEALLDRVAEGRLTVDIDTVFPLEQAADAMKHNAAGSNGKVIIDTTR